MTGMSHWHGESWSGPVVPGYAVAHSPAAVAPSIAAVLAPDVGCTSTTRNSAAASATSPVLGNLAILSPPSPIACAVPDIEGRKTSAAALVPARSDAPSGIRT